MARHWTILSAISLRKLPCYCSVAGAWWHPETSGQAPKPCSGGKFCAVGTDKAVLLGGLGKGQKCAPLHALKVLEMSANTWVSMPLPTAYLPALDNTRVRVSVPTADCDACK